MTFEFKPFRCHLAELRRARAYLEHAIALSAHEMVMVFLVRDLVVRRSAGNIHRHEPPILQQAPNVAINRSHSQLLDTTASAPVDLARTQRTIRLTEDLANGGSLFGVPLHRFIASFSATRPASRE
jgi:hypothetical protein